MFNDDLLTPKPRRDDEVGIGLRDRWSEGPIGGPGAAGQALRWGKGALIVGLIVLGGAALWRYDLAMRGGGAQKAKSIWDGAEQESATIAEKARIQADTRSLHPNITITRPGTAMTVSAVQAPETRKFDPSKVTALLGRSAVETEQSYRSNAFAPPAPVVQGPDPYDVCDAPFGATKVIANYDRIVSGQRPYVISFSARLDSSVIVKVKEAARKSTVQAVFIRPWESADIPIYAEGEYVIQYAWGDRLNRSCSDLRVTHGSKELSEIYAFKVVNGRPDRAGPSLATGAVRYNNIGSERIRRDAF